MEVAATRKYARSSARKARLIANLIRGSKVNDALNTLKFSCKKTAPMFAKVLLSAVANAEHNSNMDIDRLYISTVYVDGGSMLKRMMPRSKGRSNRILKRTCHITVKVAEK